MVRIAPPLPQPMSIIQLAGVIGSVCNTVSSSDPPEEDERKTSLGSSPSASGSTWLVVAGVAALMGSSMVWRATPAARSADIAIGLMALLPGIYGLGELGFAVQTLQDYQNKPTAYLTFTSYPEGYRGTVSWPHQFGIGIGLIAVGAAGLFVIIAVAGNGAHFRRDNRMQDADT